MKRLQTKRWKELRDECIKRDKVCRKCGKSGEQVHHIIPFNKGGKDELKNLVTLCKKHHAIADNTYFKYGLTSMAKIWLKENEQMKRIIIQDEISITQKDVDEIIEYYKNQSENMFIGILCWSGGKKEIIQEIKKLSEVGKSILLMRYRFNQWKKSDEYKKMEKEALMKVKKC